jgi:homoserine kinase
MTSRRVVRAAAPASVSNLGPGFDVLGCAVDGAEDVVEASRSDHGGIVLVDPGHPELSSDPEQHAAGIAASAIVRHAASDTHAIGIELRVTKGIPLAGGQGGSAASAVAAAVAVNELLELHLGKTQLLEAALAAEERLSGRHADNVAAALYGGIVLVRDMDPLDIVCLEAPAELRVVIVHPEQRMNTREGRAVVPMEFPRETLIYQAAQVGALVAALLESDYELIGRALGDRVAEPYRASLLPGFREARAAALAAGALGASISGSGPTAFALAKGNQIAERVADAMASAYRQRGITCDFRVSRVRSGASVR